MCVGFVIFRWISDQSKWQWQQELSRRGSVGNLCRALCRQHC